MRFLHTMYRITNPEKSDQFYRALGFELKHEMNIEHDGVVEATNYFYGSGGDGEELELTFNHDGQTYDLGTGFGHIAIGVTDLDATLASLEVHGIRPEKEPYRVNGDGDRICFVRDPDNYRVEIIEEATN